MADILKEGVPTVSSFYSLVWPVLMATTTNEWRLTTDCGESNKSVAFIRTHLPDITLNEEHSN